MISGIGSSYGNMFNYQNTINQLRLQQALAKNPDYQSYRNKVSTSQTNNSTYSSQYTSSSLDFLRNYSSTMGSVMQSANTLRSSNASSVMKSLTALSSDKSVATVTQNYKLQQGKNLSLNVTQLATAQQNSSIGAKSTAAAQQNMSFTISGKNGTYGFNIQATQSNGIAKTNGAMLREAAAAINESDAGVQATVTEKDGNATLTLTSRDTGTDSAFTVSGQLGAAEGLQNATQTAENAQYSVTEKGRTQSYTSQSNDVDLDYGRIQASLKGTGSTDISVGPDTEKVVSAVSDLLNSYNKATAFLSSNTDHGRGVATQLSHFERSLAGDGTLKQLGISIDKEGNLTLDKEALTKALEDDTELTTELLSGRYGLAETIYNRSSSAMSANSASLINNDLQAIDNSIATDPFQYMSLYSRSGVYTMSNYAALGLMMNYLA